MAALIDGLACVMLALIVVDDLRQFRIRNVGVLTLFALFVFACMVGSVEGSWLWHTIFASAVLVTLLGAFSLRLLGAGDVKLLSAASLWIGPEGAMMFAVALLLSTILYCLGAIANLLPKRRIKAKVIIPFAPSIAVAWLTTILMKHI